MSLRSETSITAMAQMQRTLPRGEAFALLALVIFFWGVHWPLMKIVLESVTPLWFGVFRLGIGALALFAVLAATGRIVLPPRGDLSVLLTVGLLQMAGMIPLSNFGVLHVPAGRSAVLVYTFPMWVAPLAVFWLRERLTPLRIVGLVLGLAGVAVLFNPGHFDWSDPDALLGNGALVLSAVLWAIAAVHIRGHRFHCSPLQLAPWQMYVALLVLVPLAWITEGPPRVAWSNEVGLILGYSGFIATAFSFWGAVTVTRALPAMTNSLAMIGVPIVGVAAAAVILGEALTLDLLAAMALVLAGLALITWADRREAVLP
jgi:drug/metabolite transporter (DMT)-like permease